MDRKAIHMEYLGRFEEALALHEGAVAVGERHQVPRRHLALGNAAVLRLTQDLPGAAEACEAALRPPGGPATGPARASRSAT